MKAVRFHEYGDPEVLRVEDVDDPVPGEGQVRVRVAATSFNGVDGNIRAGRMQGPMPLELPHIPGLDVSGTVDMLGEGAGGLRVGDPVIGFLRSAPTAPRPSMFWRPPKPRPGTVEHPAGGRGRVAPGRTHGLASVVRAHESAERATDSHQRRRRRRGRLRRAVGQGRRRARHRTASPRTSATVQTQGADEIIDHTAGDVATALGQPVDVLLNLAPISPEQFTALAALVRDGGVIVNTTVWMPAPSDEARGVRSIDLFVRSDAAQFAELAAASTGGAHRRHRRTRPTDRPRTVHTRAAAAPSTARSSSCRRTRARHRYAAPLPSAGSLPSCRPCRCSRATAPRARSSPRARRGRTRGSSRRGRRARRRGRRPSPAGSASRRRGSACARPGRRS